MTRELFTGDSRVGLADLYRGSTFLQTFSCLPKGHSSRDPRVPPVGPKLHNSCRFLPERLSRADVPNSERISWRVEQLYKALSTSHAFLGEIRVG